MTVLTKPSLIIKKEEVLEAPLVHENLCDEEKIDIHPGMPVAWVGRRPSGSLMCLSLAALFMASVGIISGLLLYRQYLHTTHRYQGFCSIPMNARQETQLRWRADPDVQVFSTFIDNTEAEDSLVERLDIGDNYEKILVVDSGRNFQFIHDFTANLTAIVDDARCFMMTLDPNVLLPPDQLLLGIEAGSTFDVSRVRTALKADLDAPRPNLMTAAFFLMDACQNKPTYMLKLDDSALVRKRSAEQPQREFIQFSGRHVQEIEIGNMAEVLHYEKEGHAAGQAPLALPMESRAR